MEKNNSNVVWAIVGLLLVMALLLVIPRFSGDVIDSPRAEVPVVVAGQPAGPIDLDETNNVLNPEPELAAETSYKLVVGVNPTVNTNQKLSPPTSSVVITGGEEQLRKLREQTKKAHQQ